MSTIEPIVPGGVGGFGGGPITVIGSGSVSSSSSSATGGSPWMGLVRIILDSGSEYSAIRKVNFPGRTYEGRLLDYGRIDKTAAVPCGMPQTGDFRVRMADTDRKWRDLFKTQTPLHRRIQVKFVQVDASEALFEPIVTGSVYDFHFGPGWVDIEARDDSWDWLDEEIAPLINRTNFPSLAPETNEAFFPIWLGTSDDLIGLQGTQLLPHIEWTGAVDRYALARHQIYDVAIYRRTTADAVFIAVDPSEYDVTVVVTVIGGKSYDLTYIDFLAQQSDGTLISADCDGAFFRPAWHGYPAVGYDPILNPGGTPGVQRNPIDCFIILMLLEYEKATAFDSAGIMELREKFETILVDKDPEAPIPGYVCDGVVSESITRRALLGRFLPCFNLDLFHNRAGEIALNFTDAADPLRPLFSDRMRDGDRCLILRESFFEDRMKPSANQCIYSFRRIYSQDRWGDTAPYDNAADQAALALPELDIHGNPITSGSPAVVLRQEQIEPSTVEFWFLRAAEVALDVVPRRMSQMALGSNVQIFDLPTPQCIEDVEICRQVGITHRDGLAAGGYVNRPAKIIGISTDLRAFRTTLTTILLEPQVIVVTGG